MLIPLDAATNRVCRVLFDDGREFTFRNVQTTPAPVASLFTQPSGCKCGQPVDISIVLDRSGTINHREFQHQKAFVTGFTSQFDFGPLQANFALVHFRKDAWTTLDMTAGTSNQAVTASISALGCCNNSTNLDSSCCCCGTSVSSGTIMGADQLRKGRANVTKILIVITDGYHNHNRTHQDCGEGSAFCRADLQWAADYARRTVPGVTVRWP